MAENTIYVDMFDLMEDDNEEDAIEQVQIAQPIVMREEERVLSNAIYNAIKQYCEINQDWSFLRVGIDKLMAFMNHPFVAGPWYHRKTINQEQLEYEQRNGWELDPDRPAEGQNVYTRRKVADIPALPEDFITSKEQYMLNVISGQIQEDRPVLVYVEHSVTNDIRPRLAGLIDTHVPNANIHVLSSSIPPDKREAYIADLYNAGVNVLITNSGLVETGIDLTQFPTIFRFEMSRSLTSMEQSNGRNFRANQFRDCYIYNPYFVKHHDPEERARYMPTVEEIAAYSMGRKLGASAVITGRSTMGNEMAQSVEGDNIIKAVEQVIVEGKRIDLRNIESLFDKHNVGKDITSTVPRYGEGPLFDITQYNPTERFDTFIGNIEINPERYVLPVRTREVGDRVHYARRENPYDENYADTGDIGTLAIENITLEGFAVYINGVQQDFIMTTQPEQGEENMADLWEQALGFNGEDDNNGDDGMDEVLENLINDPNPLGDGTEEGENWLTAMTEAAQEEVAQIMQERAEVTPEDEYELIDVFPVQDIVFELERPLKLLAEMMGDPVARRMERQRVRIHNPGTGGNAYVETTRAKFVLAMAKAGFAENTEGRFPTRNNDDGLGQYVCAIGNWHATEAELNLLRLIYSVAIPEGMDPAAVEYLYPQDLTAFEVLVQETQL
jgi:hypothetical protein